jgi:hypothetical protein
MFALRLFELSLVTENDIPTPDVNGSSHEAGRFSSVVAGDQLCRLGIDLRKDVGEPWASSIRAVMAKDRRGEKGRQAGRARGRRSSYWGKE